MALFLDKNLKLMFILMLIHVSMFVGQETSHHKVPNPIDQVNAVDWGTQTNIPTNRPRCENQVKVVNLFSENIQQGAVVAATKQDGAALGFVERLRAQHTNNDHGSVDHAEIQKEAVEKIAAAARSSSNRSFFNPLICMVMVMDTGGVQSRIGFHGVRKYSLLVAHIERYIQQKKSDKSAKFSVSRSLPEYQIKKLISDDEFTFSQERYKPEQTMYTISFPMNYKIKNTEGKKEYLLSVEFLDLLREKRSIYADYADEQHANCAIQSLVTLDVDVATERLFYCKKSQLIIKK